MICQEYLFIPKCSVIKRISEVIYMKIIHKKRYNILRYFLKEGDSIRFEFKVFY